MVYLKKIREDASAAYACGAQGAATISDNYHNVQFFAYCPMKPEKKDIAIEIMNNELPNLAKDVDAPMVDKVKKLMLKQADDSEKNNGYWMRVINQFYKYGIDSHTDYKKLIEAQTPQSIAAFVAEFLKNKNHISVIMLPEEAK